MSKAVTHGRSVRSVRSVGHIREGDEAMATYITLYKLTDQGVRNIREAPKRVEGSIKAWGAAGGRMVGFYATMGEYDYVAITESPSEELGAAFTLAQASLGNVRTVTMRAFTQNEFSDLVAKLPKLG
jgi:uncharacterized protein with GYD domain